MFALLWLVFVLSWVRSRCSICCLRRGAASQVSSLFFLVPPTTAVIAWPCSASGWARGELAGMALTVAGVALVNLERR